MLVLAGLGISDEKGITLEEIEEAKSADYLFIELYTSIWHGRLQNLERIVGKKIGILRRRDLEEESDRILRLAVDKKVVIFVPGDPLVATTHSSLIIECKKRGIDFKILHNSSILSAVCETGLHAYKFGPSVTIPLKERTKNKLESIVELIKQNKERGLHTLCFLDVDIEANKFLKVCDAIKFLVESKIIEEEEKIVVASCIGTDKQKFIWKEAKSLTDLQVDLPAVIIIPGNLHFSEREMLGTF
jgi:diphthine synthase